MAGSHFHIVALKYLNEYIKIDKQIQALGREHKRDRCCVLDSESIRSICKYCVE